VNRHKLEDPGTLQVSPLREGDTDVLRAYAGKVVQDVRPFLHGESTFRFPTGIMACFLLEKQQDILDFLFDDKSRRAVGKPPGHCSLKTA
jgi:hypothetical protein